MHLHLKPSLVVLGGFCVLVSTFYSIENARGAQAWATWKQRREAAGDSYDRASLLPPPVPDEQNFAAAPGIAEVFRAENRRALIESNDMVQEPKDPEDWRLGQSMDPARWAPARPGGPDFRRTLEAAQSALVKVSVASLRPRNRVPRTPDGNFTSDPIRILVASRLLKLRALVALREHRPGAALDDVLTLLRLAGLMEQEPAYIFHLANLTMVNHALQPIWEGVSARAWDEAQLGRLQEALGSLDVLKSFQRAAQGERLFIDAMLAEGAEKGGAALMTGVTGLRWLPRGWVYQNLVTQDRFYLEGPLACVDLRARRVDMSPLSEALRDLNPGQIDPEKFLANIAIPSYDKIVRRTARGQSEVDLARVACALERHRLAKGSYPETLTTLVPAFVAELPHDLRTGEALRYARAEGGFKLYSIGLDGKDDGGLPTPLKTERSDSVPGDWVWPSGPASVVVPASR